MTWADVARALLRWVKAVVHRLGEGSKTVAWRIGRWPATPLPLPLAGPESDEDDQEQEPGNRSGASILLRWSWLAFLAWLTLASVQRSHPIAALLTTAWCCAAWRAGGAEAAEPDHSTDAREVTEDPEPEPDPLDDTERRERLLDLARDLIGDRNGVHITALLAAAAEHQVVPAGTTGAALRRQLADWGVRTRDSLKVGGSVAAGLHADDLPYPSDPLPRYPDGSYVVG